MGRQNSESTVTLSSIALLQERFRELQRVKKMREERELLKLFSESERVDPELTMHYEPTRPFFHPELTISPGTYNRVSPCLQPESQRKYPRFEAVDTPLLMSLWPTDRCIMRASSTFDDTEVDTSLHL
ncbi:hypothetical protein IFM89_034195 [Coptis chinensis]|uniref:Uncharacterized protein n=1 Tax=Coptis chinensis TaxID=261450 RepID=A0A835H259_9MAGN|nr:hypothetical protein IFM89_034195 [Coptis chinensis]